jgi:asparagine synthase (glutamine-hydrolysing)
VDLKNGIAANEIAAMGSTLRGGMGILRTFPAELSAARQQVAAAVRVSGFLPEDRYDVQPLWSQDRKTLFVCQARLDNRAELLKALGMKDGPVAEIADSTILHAAYQKLGERCVERLAGDYAFAAYSTETQRVFAAVDPLAQYRLYYAARGGRIVLCTQLATLRGYETGAAQIDEAALGLSAEARYLPGVTPFRGIRQLSGGECLDWCDGSVETRRWWQPQIRPLIRFHDPAEYLEAAHEAFEAAVSSCLRAAAPVNATLSGGLDSGLVTAMAARLLNKQGGSLVAYTSAPATGNAVFQRSRWDADDSSFAAQTAAFQGNIQHIILRSDGRVALDLIEQIHQRSGVPVRNGANHLWLDDIARRTGPGVLLTGPRGNFSLSYTGNGGFAELLREWRWKAALHCALQTKKAEGKPLWKTLAGGIMPRDVFESLRRRLYGEKVEFLSLTTADFRKRHWNVLHPQRPTPGTRAFFALKMTQTIAVWAADPLAQWGVEWRDPTADRRLMELLLSFPLAAFAHEGRARGVARHLGRGLLPEAIRLRRTQGQQSADYAVAMAQQMLRYRSLYDRMLASAACRSIFDLPALDSALKRVEMGELSGAIVFPIDRCVDAGVFLMEQEGI